MLGAGFSSGWADPSGRIWPMVDPATGAVAGSGLVSARVVAAIPAVGRAMGVITSRMTQMPLTLWAGGVQVKPTPRLLVQPDPGLDYPTMMNALCWDYWIHGNAILYTTAVDQVGDPAAAMWLPAERVSCWQDAADGRIWYEFGGIILDTGRVVHLKRRLDPWQPWRGVGVLEQHMRAFALSSDRMAYESRLLQDSGVPSVAVTIGNPDMSQDEAEAAKSSWVEKFSGAKREPVFLPQGSTVAPLAWSPEDSQMVEAAKASRGDIADIFDLDRWYLGVADGSFNYKSAAEMNRSLVRDTLAEHIRTFEAGLSGRWCDEGLQIRLDLSGQVADDKPTTVAWVRSAVDAGLMTIDEGRAELGLSPMDEGQK